MSLYLDASAILPLFNPESGTEAVETLLENTTDEVLVSEFAATEVAAAFSRLQRTSQIGPDDARRRLSDFDSWRAGCTTVDLTAADMRLANVYVRRFDLMLKAPDALHASICGRIGAEFLTLDHRLAKAAVALGLSVAVLGA